MKEEFGVEPTSTNNICHGNIDTFDPLINKKSNKNKKKLRDILKRRDQGKKNDYIK